MKYSEIMIRYGELSTKGKNRKYFIKKLAKNVRSSLQAFPELEIDWTHDRMYIYLNGADGEAVMEGLADVSGIANYSPVVKVEKSLPAAQKMALELVQNRYEPGKTFKIATKRSDRTFPYDTMEMNRLVGETVFEAIPDIEVSMKQPDIQVSIEVREDGIYLYTDLIKGVGGMPVGSNGKGMLMLSGGIDSPVAGYLAIKRGLELEGVHFHSPPYTSPQALQKAKDLGAKLAKYTGSFAFIQVPFTEIQETIKKEIPDEYSMTINRRFMMRITDEIRRQRGGLAIVNGESLGQVASQTIESMYAINAVTTTPVIRPLVTMDKMDIIKIAEKIDTYEISVQPYEDCCTVFAPANPKTRPNFDRVEDMEAALDIDGLVERAVAGMSISHLSYADNSQNQEAMEFEGLL